MSIEGSTATQSTVIVAFKNFSKPGNSVLEGLLAIHPLTANPILHDLDLNLQRQKFEMLISQKWRNFFDRFWYLPLNGAIADVALHHFDLNCQCQTFSCFALTMKIVQWQWTSPADLPRLAVELLLLYDMSCRLVRFRVFNMKTWKAIARLTFGKMPH